MRSNGYNKNTPIDVIEYNEQRYIIDGHHRASAARRTHTLVTIRLIDNIENHHTSFSSIKDVVSSSKTAGPDRLERSRK